MNSEPVVKLLGISIVRALCYITLLCQTAGKYINVLPRTRSGKNIGFIYRGI